MINLRYFLPFFMQSREGKKRERKVGYRAIRQACEKGNYDGCICEWAYFAIVNIGMGWNPRRIMGEIPGKLEENQRNPRNPEYRGCKDNTREGRKDLIDLVFKEHFPKEFG